MGGSTIRRRFLAASDAAWYLALAIAGVRRGSVGGLGAVIPDTSTGYLETLRVDRDVASPRKDLSESRPL